MHTVPANTDDKPTRVNYGPVPAVLVTLGAFFSSQIVAVLIVSLIPLLLGWSNSQTENWFESSGVVPQFLLILVVATINFWVIKYFLERTKTSLRAIGLDKPEITHLWLALIGFVAYFILYFISLGILSGILNINQEQELGFDKTTSGLGLLFIFFSLVIVPPLIEEFVMRGFLFTGLRQKMTFAVAAIITSTIFAVAHLPEGKDGLLWVGAVDTFVLSLVLCYLREHSRSLWPPIGLHMIKNGLAFVIVFKVFT